MAGRCDLSLDAWFLAHLENNPSPEGSEGLRIIAVLLYSVLIILHFHGNRRAITWPPVWLCATWRHGAIWACLTRAVGGVRSWNCRLSCVCSWCWSRLIPRRRRFQGHLWSFCSGPRSGSCCEGKPCLGIAWPTKIVWHAGLGTIIASVSWTPSLHLIEISLGIYVSRKLLNFFLPPDADFREYFGHVETESEGLDPEVRAEERIDVVAIKRTFCHNFAIYP